MIVIFLNADGGVSTVGHVTTPRDIDVNQVLVVDPDTEGADPDWVTIAPVRGTPAVLTLEPIKDLGTGLRQSLRQLLSRVDRDTRRRYRTLAQWRREALQKERTA